jgi:F-type H+-transporting ATPase subunit delta
MASGWSLARALHRAARLSGEADAVGADLDRVAALLAELPGLGRFLGHPRIALAVKEELLCPHVQSGLGRRLVCELVAARQVALLPAVAAAYRTTRRRAEGRVAVTVRSPRQLDPGDVDALESALARWAGAVPELAVRIDPSLIGGLSVSLDGRVVEDSLRGRLDDIRHRLLNA